MDLGVGPIIAGAAVGIVVGLTGSGGGALLTPILILFLGVQAQTAVASDLVATLVMRPVAGAIHLREHTVHWPIVVWLAIGSVPAALLAGAASGTILPATSTTAVLSKVIGAALLLTGAIAIWRRLTVARRRRSATEAPGASPGEPLVVRRLATLLVGIVGGLLVGLTSVGSGTLMLVLVGILYPSLSSSELVGTDLVQAVPLVAAAAVGHLIGGTLHITLTTAIIIGGVPGAFVGAVASRRVPSKALGIIVALVIFGSGCALIGWIPGSIVGAVALMVAWCVRGRIWPERGSASQKTERTPSTLGS